MTGLNFHVSGTLAATAIPAAACLVTVLILAGRLHHAAKHAGLLAALGRLAAGMDLEHGRDHWTNAGWLTRPGEVALVKAGAVRKRASRWQHQNYAFRLCVRCGWLAAFACWVVEGVLGAIAATVAVAVLTVYVRTVSRPSWLSWSWLPRPWRNRGRVSPMAEKLATAVGTSAKATAESITWNEDYANAEPGAVVARQALPAGFKATGGERKTVQQVWQDRIGFELTFAWRTEQDRPELVMSRAHQLPKLVLLKDYLEKIEALPEHKTAIGIDDQGNLVCWDWSTEYPHGMLNAGSRHGKTETEMAMVGQVLRKGGNVTYIDPKRVSIQGLKGLPRLTLMDNPRGAGMVAMWRAIEAWGKDMDDRIDRRTEDPTVEFSRSLLVLEEVNQFSEMCDEFWDAWPVEDERYAGTLLWKPKRARSQKPPVWRIINHGVWEGAFCKKNVLIAGQNIEYQTVKGIRNSIGMRLLGGYQHQNWQQLVGTTPVPPAPPEKGRWCMVNGGAQTWVQAVIADLVDYESAAIWRDYARNGRRMDGSRLPIADEPVSAHGGTAWQVSTDGTVVSRQPLTAITDPRGILVSLTGAVDRGLVPGASKRALEMDRYRSDRDDLPDGLKFPEPDGKDGTQTELFWSAELAAFNQARRGAARGVA